MPTCPKGTIHRKPYTRASGAKIPGRCIPATSQSGLKRSELDAATLAAKKQSHKRAASLTRGPARCPSGEIKRDPYMRAGYKRADGTRVAAAVVPATCVPATGKAKLTGHKGKPLFVLDAGALAKYGYEDVKHLTAAQRHAALNRALKDGIKPLPLFRRVNALYVLNENKDPKLAAAFRADRDYIKTTPEWQKRAH